MLRISKNYFTFPFYIPRIYRLWSNWPEYLVNYVLRRNIPAEYRMRNGARLVDSQGDLAGTLAVVFVRREYGPLASFRTIVDVGANMGSFALYAAQCCPDAKIYCFEPEQRTFVTLKRNIDMNGLQGRVLVFQRAIASRAGPRDMSVVESLRSSFHISAAGAGCQTVQCVTLTDILSDPTIETIDLLKLNCEGAEHEILEACSPAEFNRIANIRLEYHNLESPARTGKSLARLLERHGYRIERFTRYLNTSGFIWAARTLVSVKFWVICFAESMARELGPIV